jgi:hypothetical protein
MASKNFVVKHGITVGGIEVIDATGQVNSQSLTSAALVLSGGATKTSDLTNDSGFITSSALSGYALSSAIPTNTSQLTNDSGFITSSALSGYALSSAIPTNTSQLTNGANFASITEVDNAVATALSTSIGNINSALDAINGANI